jgi:hypothetical protein
MKLTAFIIRVLTYIRTLFLDFCSIGEPEHSKKYRQNIHHWVMIEVNNHLLHDANVFFFYFNETTKVLTFPSVMLVPLPCINPHITTAV